MPTERPENRARTKIVATVGPACRQVSTLEQLIAAGADVFRLNMAHGDHTAHQQTIEMIRSAADRPIAILVDLAGPKIRLGELWESPTDCPLAAEFFFVRGERASAPDELVCSYPRLIDDVAGGDRIMLADGVVCLEVVEKNENQARCRVVSAGEIRSRQGVNLPGASLTTTAFTEEDQSNAVWAAEQGVDFVGLSFVRRAEEIRSLQTLLREQNSTAQVIAKIEKREALENLEQIVAAADGVMVARGDLGVEIDVAEIAPAQKKILAACQRFGKPAIVATQMLESMHHSRRPTRAEATDVANAILDGADACMLSGETAIGQYPLAAVETMNRIMLAAERMILAGFSPPMLSPNAQNVPSSFPAASGVHPTTSAVVRGAVAIARDVEARLVVISTRSGATARVKAKQRDTIPAIGVSSRPDTLRRMALYWGVTPLPQAPAEYGPELRSYIGQWGKQNGCLAPGDKVVYIAGTGLVKTAHNAIVVHEVE